MSVGSIINQATGKIYDDLVPQGGGIPLAKGQIITALAGGEETAFPDVPPADGSVLSYDSNTATGLRYIANPAGIPLDYQQLISANPANATAIVPAPAQNNYVLTSDNTLGAGSAGLAWKPLAGPAGTITTIAPLQDLEPVAGTNELSIAFTAVKGEIPAGNGTAKTGALVPAPPQDKYVLTSDATTATGLKWSPPTGASGIIDATAPLVDDAGVGTNTISINFSASVGEIPYGNGTAKTGALTNVPTAGQILGIAGGVPAWINAGGSGTITALAPLTEFADGNASKVAVNFTGKGDLIVGGGVQVGGQPVAGVILPAGANDMVLTANSATASGLEWKASGSGSSAIIFRNSVDDTPLTITAPLTANDTCVITADRTYHTYNQQVKNTPSTTGANVSALANQITFFTWTAPSNILITSFVANVYIVANAQFPEQLTDDGVCDLCDAGGTTTLLGSDPSNWGIIQSGNVAFNSIAGNTYQVVSGTTYTFIFNITNIQGTNPSVDLIDTGGGNFSGNITINGTDYAGLPATFTLTPPAKFRITNDLTGKTSATCESFSSQSFVASEDLQSWVATGGINGGVAFVP